MSLILPWGLSKKWRSAEVTSNSVEGSTISNALIIPTSTTSPSLSPSIPPNNTQKAAEEPTPTVHRESETITVGSCRSCSDCYTYTKSGGNVVKIICGVPQVQRYKALSYVWGKTQYLHLSCSKCNSLRRFPMEDGEKFRHLMTLASDGEYVWMDSISIDQDDPIDKESQIAVMGKIFGGAFSVGVLLPPSDKVAFQLLCRIAFAATEINGHQAEFSKMGNSEQTRKLSKTCQQFYNLVEQFETSLPHSTYWNRAWTFQEWVMAFNIDLTWEGRNGDQFSIEGVKMPSQLVAKGIKRPILQAATLMAVYTLAQGPYSRINVGHTRVFVPKMFNAIKRLFPDETAFLPDDLIDREATASRFCRSNLESDMGLGLRTTFSGNMMRMSRHLPLHELFSINAPPVAVSSDEAFFGRLSLMLSAFTVTQREATFEADLVSCWASMCNIKYRYDVNDSYAVALQKVVYALRRQHGLPVYNFLVNTVGSTGGLDLEFFQYAKRHRQCNATNNTEFSETPIFSGRVDTAIHLRNAIMVLDNLIRLQGNGTPLRKVEDGYVVRGVSMAHRSDVMEEFGRLSTGDTDKFLFTDVAHKMTGVLDSIPTEQLARKQLVVAIILIGFEVNRVWAICPSGISLEEAFVARESESGTMVIAAPVDDQVRIVAYLTLTHQKSGTHLMKVDERGQISMGLATPTRSDIIMNGNRVNDSILAGQIRLRDEEILAL